MSIFKLIARRMPDLKIKLIPLFHPAAIIYKRALMPLWEEDMEFVKTEIKDNLVQKELF